MTVLCVHCQGSGIELDKAGTQPGRLMPLCTRCQGAGHFGDDVPLDVIRAIFLVGTRFIVRITTPRQKGGFVEMDVDWSPHMPEETGKRRLRPSERRDYEAGRAAAMQQHMAQVGGGEFSLIDAKGRH